MNDAVNVVITGPTGCGKSAVYGHIEVALKAIGFDVLHAKPEEWAREMPYAHDHEQTEARPPILMSEVNQPGIKWERQRACAAATAAGYAANVWVPQAWLDAFMAAYERPVSEPAGGTP